ncbi:PIN domain-containing protein [Aromatoleum toluvorans]|uniref:Ribonuclease VapC n=1 Tax=Aromatoleum toluvorans TaxID=92002 RepID=A0ABX1PYW5_9RHOO|nr:type II toxin-antitoxin system VapC family toxin [Aromatoleum toluvorans]NMG43897.1 PIN domain-containing protein [Aromatoleum toluvorans]
MSCVVDTNVLIYFLGATADVEVLDRIEHALRDQARVSVITRMEILGWRGHTDESRASARFLLDQLGEVALTSAVVERVIEMRSAMAIKLPDAIIAASALIEGLPLMTHNARDFKRIPGLELIDPLVG